MEKKGGWISGKVRKSRKSSSEGTSTSASTPQRRLPLGPLDNDLRGTAPPATQSPDKTLIKSATHIELTEVEGAPPPESPRQFQLSVNDPYGDRSRTLIRYKDAVKELREALKNVQGGGKLFQVPEFDSIPDDVGPAQLQEAINHIFEQAGAKIEKSSRWTKCKRVFEIMYLAISPVLKNLLVIARDAQTLNPYGILFGGLFVLMMMADRELKRRDEIEKGLDYISRQLGQLQIIETLPSAEVMSQTLINSEMDVRTSVMRYIAIQIRHESRHFGIIAKVTTAFVKDNEELDTAGTKVESAVSIFNSALSHFGHGVSFKTYESVESIRRDMTLLLSTQTTTATAPPPVVEKFLVPYEENPHFTGRKELLKSLRTRLCEIHPKQYNHRIALHGLGGVGKTQTALAYAHTHKAEYDAVYWIVGVNQASILSSFQDIAKRVGLVKTTTNLHPNDIAKSLLAWLGIQDNWLVVIDNLDDVGVINNYLPPTGKRRHTLITTRNQNSYEIPAEGMEIGVLDSDDAIELLILRCNMPPSKFPVDEVREEASKIVMKLGYLALAIEQASAYIRETSKNIFKFLPNYCMDRKKYHNWKPKGNWTYSEAVATTWLLSFQQVEEKSPSASHLLRLLAFLNPDGILLEFLEAGRPGLPTELQNVVAEDNLYEALSELERFSLIRREDDTGEDRVTIHRLVQAVIKDEMNEEQFSSMAQAVISLSDQAFPQHWDREMRLLCRKYEEQVVVTLSDLKVAESEDSIRVLNRVGKFMNDDGKYKQAAELRLKLVEVSTKVNGPDHPETLRAMAQLAETYRNQRRLDEAMRLQEQVLELSRNTLGDDHPDTWSAMGDLAATYRGQGRRAEAIRLQVRVLALRLKRFGEEHPETLRAMGNLGATYRSEKRLADALKLQEKVYEVRLRTLGHDNPDTLGAMSNVAVTYRYQRHFDKAAQLQEKLVSSRKLLLGEEHPDTLQSMNSLASTRYSQKRWNEAQELQEKVLELREKIMGEGHPDTLWTMRDLALTYRWQGDMENAIKIQERLLELRARELGPEHKETVSAMKRLAEMYHAQSRWADATALQRRVVQAMAPSGAPSNEYLQTARCSG